jgi:hypothetical protein
VASDRRVNAGIRGFGSPETTSPRISHHFRDGSVALFVIVHTRNEFVFARDCTTRVARTTPLVMSEMLSTTDGVDWGVLFAAATLQLAPVLGFILAAQRYVIAGLAAGAVKGWGPLPRDARGLPIEAEGAGHLVGLDGGRLRRRLGLGLGERLPGALLHLLRHLGQDAGECRQLHHRQHQHPRRHRFLVLPAGRGGAERDARHAIGNMHVQHAIGEKGRKAAHVCLILVTVRGPHCSRKARWKLSKTGWSR